MSCCGKRPAWKDDVVPGHQFQDVDVDEFVERSCITRLRYGFVFLTTLKAVLMYIADLAITALMFALVATTSTPGECNTGASLGLGLTFRCNAKGSSNELYVWRPYIILASVMFSFLLLFLDWRKALGIIKSRYIAEALTSAIAYRYYVLRSYPHFCFFLTIKQSRKLKDQLTFFVFFTLRGWKKLMFAELPRTFINAWTIKDILAGAELTKDSVTPIFGISSLDLYLNAYYKLFTSDITVAATLALQTFTVLVWVISFLSSVVAFIIYVPLLCEIQGNLKEYCVRKVDKRLNRLLKGSDEDASTADYRSTVHGGDYEPSAGFTKPFAPSPAKRDSDNMSERTWNMGNVPSGSYQQHPLHHAASYPQMHPHTHPQQQPLLYGSGQANYVAPVQTATPALVYAVPARTSTPQQQVGYYAYPARPGTPQQMVMVSPPTSYSVPAQRYPPHQ